MNTFIMVTHADHMSDLWVVTCSPFLFLKNDCCNMDILHRYYNRPERLIDLIVNRDYWEIIDVQTIIVMSISYILC